MDGSLPGTHRDDEAPKKKKNQREKTKQNKHLHHKLMPLNNFSLPLERNDREVKTLASEKNTIPGSCAARQKRKCHRHLGSAHMDGGRRIEKEGGRKQPRLPWFSFPPFPCAGERDVSYCF